MLGDVYILVLITGVENHEEEGLFNAKAAFLIAHFPIVGSGELARGSECVCLVFGDTAGPCNQVPGEEPASGGGGRCGGLPEATQRGGGRART